VEWVSLFNQEETQDLKRLTHSTSVHAGPGSRGH